MNEISIHIENDFFVSGDDQIVNTTFYLECDGMYFPDNQWTDYVYPVLNIWSEKLLSYRWSKTAHFELFFMDGAYKLSVHKYSDEMLVVRCINFRNTPMCELEFMCTYSEFLNVILNATRTFIDLLREKKLHTGRFQPVYNQAVLQENRLRTAIISKEKSDDIQ